MTQVAESTFQFDGRDYRLVIAKSTDSLTYSCGPVEEVGVLGQVVCSMWMRSPETFLNSIDARTGQSCEGEIAFGFEEDHQPPRTVTVFAHDAEETVDTDSFERFVVEFALACIDAGRKIELDTGARLRDRLLSMRNRGK